MTYEREADGSLKAEYRIVFLFIIGKHLINYFKPKRKFMKSKILLAIFLIASSIISAQNSKYISAMEKYVKMMDTATTSVTLWQTANGFERIANSEKSEWLPDYWAAYSFVRVILITNDKDQIDVYCDKADAFLEKAEALSPNNSEILAMKGFAAAMRINVNPMMRGRVYGPKSGELYEQAMKADENNPRPYFLRGEGIMNTPKMFGGGAEKACPYLEKAIKKFESFKPANSISPDWGLETCKKRYDENCKFK